MVKRVIFGEVANEGVANLRDVGSREFLMLAVLAIAVLLFGVWPAPLVEVMDQSLGQLLIHVAQSKL
jgi:NADH-quinone oxidoreductase subunit M